MNNPIVKRIALEGAIRALTEAVGRLASLPPLLADWSKALVEVDNATDDLTVVAGAVLLSPIEIPETE